MILISALNNLAENTQILKTYCWIPHLVLV